MTGLETHAPAFSLTIRDMTLTRGPRTILEAVNLTAKSGDVVILHGDNGAGKTTFLRALAGLLPRTKASLSISKDGTLIAASDFREYVFFLGHRNGVDEAFTVEENLKFWARIYCVSKDKIISTAQAIHLEDALSRPAHILSAGQKRRLALGRAVISNKPVWLMDEPTASLDTASKELVSHLINQHSQVGGICIIATHDPLAVNSARSFSLTAA